MCKMVKTFNIFVKNFAINRNMEEIEMTKKALEAMAVLLVLHLTVEIIYLSIDNVWLINY